MAIDVTVLGVAGTTVTIPFTSATNAAAAQAALAGISNLVTGGVLTQVNYTGGATVPSVSTAEGGVIATSSISGLSPFSIGGQYVSAVQGSAGDQSIIVNFGANNAIVASGAGGSTVGGTPTVVSGPGGAEIGNLGSNTQVFLGGAAIQNFSELGIGVSNPTATVWVTTPVKGTANFDDSAGATTINLDTVASPSTGSHIFGQTLIVNNNGDGQTTVNVTSNSSGGLVDGDGMSFRGNTTIATTVNAAGGTDSLGNATGGVSLWALLKSGNAVIKGDGSNVVVFPTGTGVAATLFGGSGSDIDIGGSGFYQGGTAGGNVFYGGTVSGSTTLVGGGNNDVLVSQSQGTQLIAGGGNENLFGLAPGTTFTGQPVAQALPSKQTLMDGLQGGDTYITGNAAGGSGTVTGGTNIFSVNDTNGGNLFQEGANNQGSGALANTATITGFASGIDTISLSNPLSGSYSLVGASTVAPSAGQVAYQVVGGNTQVNFGDGTTWTLMNVTNLQNTDFH